MSRPAVIPAGVWPPRMSVEMAAGYCGERSAESFMRGVKAKVYPEPRIKSGRKQLWWKDDLDQAIGPSASATGADVLADLLPCLASCRAS
jgi:hypothetical protein